MKHRRNMQHPAAETAGSSSANLVLTFLAALDSAVISYERLLVTGLALSDHQLARDQNYACLLNAGRTIFWIGGDRAIAHAARLIARQATGGSTEHFERLWCGLMPNVKT